MKKQIAILSLALLALMPAVFSCNKQPSGSDTTQEIVMPDPATKAAAKTVEFKAGNLPKYEDTQASYEVLSIEFTEGGRYIMKRRVTAVKSKVGDIEIIVGMYTESNGNYNMSGVGTVNVSTDNKTVEWKPSGDQNKDNQTTTEANVKKTTTTGTDESNLARTWRVENCKLTVTGNNVAIERGFSGLNLEEIAKYAAENGVSQLKNKLDRFVGYNVANILFTGDKTFCISFTGANAIEGAYNLNTSSKKFSYDFSSSDNSFFHGTGSGGYEFTGTTKAYVSMSLSLEGYNGTLEMNLAQAN